MGHLPVYMNINLDTATPTDRQLIERHLDGDRDAFRQIVERHQAMVCALGLSACGEVARSEDLAQEVFIAAWKQLPELREPEKLRGWLAGITRNLINNAFRRQQRTPTARAEQLTAEIPSDGAGPRERAISADEATLMWQVLADIPANYREPMVLFYREQRSVTVVAAALEISEEAVRQRLVRGRAMLTERMAKLVEETLERSAPTPAFAAAVLSALPLSLGSTLTISETAVGRVSVGEMATATGAVGGALLKGGGMAKLMGGLLVIPALINGLMEFARITAPMDGVTDAKVRRRVEWLHVIRFGAMGVAAICIIFGLEFIKSPSLHGLKDWIYWGLFFSATITLWVTKSRLKKIEGGRFPSLPALAENSPTENRVSVEYRSGTTLLGWPLLHVRFAEKADWRGSRIKAWIAISNGQSVGRLFAWGKIAVAPVSIGLVSVGAFSLGGLAVGGWVIGFVGVGWMTKAAAGAALMAADGVFVAAGGYATGTRVVFGPEANSVLAKTFIEQAVFFQTAPLLMHAIEFSFWFVWVVPLILMSWRLWRTRAIS